MQEIAPFLTAKKLKSTEFKKLLIFFAVKLSMQRNSKEMKTNFIQEIAPFLVVYAKLAKRYKKLTKKKKKLLRRYKKIFKIF